MRMEMKINSQGKQRVLQTGSLDHDIPWCFAQGLHLCKEKKNCSAGRLVQVEAEEEIAAS